MSLQVTVLGSGSKGNCTLVRTAETALLVDAGLSARETLRRLGEVSTEAPDVQGILLSHEHGDHTAGLKVLHGRHGLPVYANSGTMDALARQPKFESIHWQIFTTGAPFTVGDIQVEPFAVPHDAYEPVGFVFRSGQASLGVVTDMGAVTSLIRQRLNACHALVVEANHDVRMVQDAPRPWYLKQRILGRQGHLSNDGAAEMLSEIAGPHLQHVFLAHISDECNTAELALQTAQRRLREAGQDHIRVSVTFSDRVSESWQYAPSSC